MSTFYNPYNFVPVEARTAPQKRSDLPREGMANLGRGKERMHVTHERYVPKTYSGRIVARLTTVTPVALGSTQTRRSKEDYATVEPYVRDGSPAIPASSLKGMLGSLMEAASNGPLRVLTNRAFSYRRGMTEALSAIGLVVEEGKELKLKPMCLPALESKDGGRTFVAPPHWRPHLRALFPTGRGSRSSSEPESRLRPRIFGTARRSARSRP